ncbi:MAG: MATE family efflux transporter [Clostridia bacterium]|nr:MATE family efflux transporter [Clostridia bacterium]
MKIHLYDRFTYKKLLRFTLPSIAMMVFISIYGIVDGFFVSNYVGKVPFAALNYIYPFLMILGSLGFMFGTGGSALIAKTLGEGDREKANRTFSLIILVTLALGAIFTAVGELFLEEISYLLGATGKMHEGCVEYGRVFLIFMPALMLQFVFQGLCVTAEKPKLGLWSTVAAGVTNMLLDWLFVAVLPFGLAGAAWATGISQFVGAAIPLVYFMLPNSSLLKTVRPKFDWRSLVKVCTNGSSELMTNISSSVVCILYNYRLYDMAGEDGVAAYCVIMYVAFIFISTYVGYSVGCAPIISYNLGADNKKELKNVLKKSIVIIGVCSVLMLSLSLLLARPLSLMFVGYDPALLELTVNAFSIYSFSFLFAGIAIFGSSFFTALNNGLISAVISFLRTLVFQVAAVLLLPLLWGVDGIWGSIIVAELLAAIMTVALMLAYRKRYGY